MARAEKYIVYPEATHGRKDSDIDMRRKTGVVRSSHWEIVIGGKPVLNPNKLHINTNSKIETSTSKPK